MYEIKTYTCGVGVWYYIQEKDTNKFIIESCDENQMRELLKILNQQDGTINKQDEEIQRLKSRLSRHYG